MSRVAGRCSGRGSDRSTRRGSRALSVGPSVPARQSPVRLSPGISIQKLFHATSKAAVPWPVRRRWNRSSSPRSRKSGGGAGGLSGRGLRCRRRVRLRVEQLLEAHPLAVDFLAEPAVDRDPIEIVAESFLARFRAGERPSIEDYAAVPRAGRPDPRAAAGAGAARAGPVATATPSPLRGPPAPAPDCRGSSATTRSSARSAGAAWGSSTRRCSSRWAARRR